MALKTLFSVFCCRQGRANVHTGREAAAQNWEAMNHLLKKSSYCAGKLFANLTETRVTGEEEVSAAESSPWNWHVAISVRHFLNFSLKLECPAHWPLQGRRV